MKKLRLSYSLLSAWERGQIQDVVGMYFHTHARTSPQMEYGTKFHKDMAEHVEKYNAFPDWFFNKELLVPECEKIITVPYNELFDLKGVFDCWDNKDLYEFKTGVQSSSDWCKTYQLPIYFLIGELSQTEIEKAYLIRHNQYKKATDFSIVYNSQRLRDKARNFIDSLGPEIHQYFMDQGLLG